MVENDLKKKYPWLNLSNTVEEYLPPEYYKRLLLPYTFGSVSDLDLLEEFLSDKSPSRVLELGCGSGRASAVVTQLNPNAAYTFSDLSDRMLSAAKEHLPSRASFVVSDAVEFMEHTRDQYDFVYTLWSFSHSTHQHIHRLGPEEGKRYLVSTIKKFVTENLRAGGSFFMIHFDSLSDEQRILMRQWKRVFPAFANSEEQSPSKQIIDQVLLELDNIGALFLSVKHLLGDPIMYASESELLEVFMNFHLETYFNRRPDLSEVINDISSRIMNHKNTDGFYSITPGCYVYSFTKP